MPDTVISQVNALEQGMPNDIDFFDSKKRPIEELYITRFGAGETESPHVKLIEPEHDVNPISAYADKITELVERQDITTIELEQGMGIEK